MINGRLISYEEARFSALLSLRALIEYLPFRRYGARSCHGNYFHAKNAPPADID